MVCNCIILLISVRFPQMLAVEEKDKAMACTLEFQLR